MMRHIKTNLKTATNIGSEESALDNTFTFSLIKSCKLSHLVPEKYIAFLLRKLKDSDWYTEKTPCDPATARCRHTQNKYSQTKLV